ncbi:transcriptional regulator, AraC family [Aliarcobacter faecis]|uniref:helix-turn-helix domain-containing protein n=1 Tax=Aliarcobacter faecis TaxID=1564138 RepID=UPI00047D1363|nr:helix-turn-helix domain-containing protein [Aliarcobacter faecis]QKF72509.1 transcriptional regulator, AraC family [Aliarcobacter faecis]
MENIQKVNYLDLIELSKKISNPFSREIYIGKIKEEFGDGFTIFYDLGNGIAVYVRNFIPKKDILLIEECNVSGGSLIFNLSSNIKFIYKDKKEYILKKNSFLLGLSSNKFYVEVPLKKDLPLIEFAIGIKEELFLKLAHPIENIQEYMKKAHKQSYYILKDLQIDTLQFELFSHFKNEKSFEDILNSIYLESRTTNLLHYTIEKIAKTLNKSLDKNRIYSLERAKEIIMKEYNQNLSIKDIAYKSAINECYLKKDFKEYFGMTILEMIQKRRLEVAKELLNNNFNVNEVATKVGYKHSGHFSKLFFDYFNISPNSYKKQFTNY